MKRSALAFTLLLVPVDYLMILLAGATAYLLRYETVLTSVRPVIFEISYVEYIKIVALVGIIWLPIFALAQLYAIRIRTTLINEFTRVVLGCSTGLVVIVFIIFFRHELFGSRFIVLFGWLLSILFVFMGRAIIRSIQRSLFGKGIGTERVALIGDDAHAHALAQAIARDPKSGLQIVRQFRRLDGATYGMLDNMVRNSGADMILHADRTHSNEEVHALWRYCQEHHLDFAYIAGMQEASMSNVAVTTLGGVPFIELKRTPLEGWGRIIKRGIDICGSLFMLVVISPFATVISIMIKADTPGPVLVSLTRVGEGNKAFQLYKFRSMVSNAHALKRALVAHNERNDGPLFKMANDPRVTAVGRVLRKYSLDELPNFINVLKGEMSMVGPRPHEPEEVSRYTGEQKKLLTIKPGITGLAQISGRSDLAFSEEARLDTFYIENWNFWLDIQILLRTPWVVIKGKNAS